MYIPDSVTISVSKINVEVNELSHGKLTHLAEGKISLEY